MAMNSALLAKLREVRALLKSGRTNDALEALDEILRAKNYTAESDHILPLWMRGKS